MKSVAEMNKKLDILIESSQGGLTHNGSQSEDALRTSENEDDEDSTSEEDEDDKFDDDKGDDHHDDETDDDDDDDLGGDGVGAGQDEAHTGDVRNDKGVVVPEVVSRDDDTGKMDDAKNSDPVEPIAEIKHVYLLFGHHFFCAFLCGFLCFVFVLIVFYCFFLLSA
ncbi:uncharacterized protein LOC133032955 [Cannabis sativa]|uniref:uncharacterized protein LOC133032955 n=1 Tax=Cannabis sativa TaxID=3483 RepID=UPI0029C9C9BA|nr:uncharacterized protein LOC133032955 [Cannabis sativa]